MLPVTRRKPQTELLEAAGPARIHSLPAGEWRGCYLGPMNIGSGDGRFQVESLR